MAQQNITTLQAAINSQLADNTSGDISAADVRDNLINMTDSLLFNTGSTQSITGSLTVTGGITGSLQGIATTSTSASFATTASYANTAASSQTATSVYTFATNANSTYYPAFVGASFSSFNILTVDNGGQFSYNPSTNTLTVPNIEGTGSYALIAHSASYAATASVLLGSVTSASYAATASLSQATIGAGDPSTYPAGGEIQFKGGTGPGSAGGKNTWSSAFLWNPFSNGLTVGDPNTSYTNGTFTLATGYDSTANGNYSVSHGSSSYANGEGSFSQGKGVTATGNYSHAEGQNTTATGNYSHAEGLNNTATGDYSHAEGNANTAFGNLSHAEGFNTTSEGVFSHTEGNSTYTVGGYSHAEGYSTTAYGDFSHAEGFSTIARGTSSHAEGLGTIASGSYQHVQGQYNTQGDSTSLMIVGNGTSAGARKDAFKVRMSGSIILPTTQSATPSWTGTDGEMVFATISNAHYFYVWMSGGWRSGSLS